MKLITTLIIFISTIAHGNLVQISNKQSLERILQRIEPGKDLWIVGQLADSIENEIMEGMVQEFPGVTSWEPLSFEDYRITILIHGLKISHTEVHREIITKPQEEWISQLDLDPLAKKIFWDEFTYRFSAINGGIYKQVLMHVVRD